MQRSEPLDRVLARLDGVVAQNGHHMALCPAHADRNPSLKIDVNRNGDVLLHCFAGCMTEDVLAALDLTFRDLSPEPRQPPPPAPKRIVKTTNYPIRDRHGNLVATHRRVDYDDGTKDVTWPPGTRPKELPLYGIHQRYDHQTRVIVVEGEKARDALDPVTPPDCLVVGTVCGAGPTPNLDVLSDLAGLDVFLWPDNDAAGRKHMQRIAARLERDAQWISWPDAPLKGDAADWVAAGGDDPFAPDSGLDIKLSPPIQTLSSHEREEASEELVSDPMPIRFRWMEELVTAEPNALEWVVAPWLPSGGILKIDGAPKAAGKTTFILAMIAAVTSGRDFLGYPVKQGKVVMLTEQGGGSMAQAATLAGLADSRDLAIATFVDFAQLDWPAVCAGTFAHAQAIGAVLIVVDTLPACSKVRGDEENSSGAAMEAMEPLQIGVAQTGIAVAIVFHDKKSGGEVGQSGRGSSAYAGAVDVILHLTRPGGNMPPTVRKIDALSRYPETPTDLFVDFRDGGYVNLGGDQDVQAAQVRRALIDLLPRTAVAAMPIDDRKAKHVVIEGGILPALAAADCKTARSTLDRVLIDGLRTGLFGVTGDGKPHRPKRYWLADPDAPTNSSDAPFAISEDFLSAPDTLSSDGYGASEERNGGETWTPDQQAAFWREP